MTDGYSIIEVSAEDRNALLLAELKRHQGPKWIVSGTEQSHVKEFIHTRLLRMIPSSMEVHDLIEQSKSNNPKHREDYEKFQLRVPKSTLRLANEFNEILYASETHRFFVEDIFMFMSTGYAFILESSNESVLDFWNDLYTKFKALVGHDPHGDLKKILIRKLILIDVDVHQFQHSRIYVAHIDS